MPIRKSKSGLAVVDMAGLLWLPVYDSQAVNSCQQSAHHRRGLAEQDLALLVGIDAGLRAQLETDRFALTTAGRWPTVSSNHFFRLGKSSSFWPKFLKPTI